MRAAALGTAVAVLGVLGVASAAGPGDEIQVTRATLSIRQVPVLTMDGVGFGGPPRIPLVDVDIRGSLPEGFALDASTASVGVEVLLNWQEVDSETLAPGRRRGVWEPIVIQGPTVWVTYASWYRARLDLRRETFRFRTRGVDPAIMQGDPEGVPLVLRIGNRTLGATLDFWVSDSGRWQFTRWEPRTLPGLPR